jgi:hypothetical protein
VQDEYQLCDVLPGELDALLALDPETALLQDAAGGDAGPVEDVLRPL